ncbi:MAG: hypothetical protein AAFY19_11470 [Pseudomonadota bacterium]
MTTTGPFEPVGKQRFTIEWISREQWIVARATRSSFMLPFFSLWLVFWTLGGVAAVATLLNEPHLFIALWLVGWALGWVYAASMIAWQLAGQYRLTISDGALVHAWSMPGIERAKSYDLSQIRDLDLVQPPVLPLFGSPKAEALLPPFLSAFSLRGNTKSISFVYEGKPRSLAMGLGMKHTELVIEWLQQRVAEQLGQRN